MEKSNNAEVYHLESFHLSVHGSSGRGNEERDSEFVESFKQSHPEFSCDITVSYDNPEDSHINVTQICVIRDDGSQCYKVCSLIMKQLVQFSFVNTAITLTKKLY